MYSLEKWNEGSSTVIVVSSVMAAAVFRAFPATSVITAPETVSKINDPVDVVVTSTENTPGLVSVIVSMVMSAVPALSKSAAVTVALAISSLNVTV